VAELGCNQTLGHFVLIELKGRDYKRYIHVYTEKATIFSIRNIPAPWATAPVLGSGMKISKFKQLECP
jgi:hypothetical protein